VRAETALKWVMVGLTILTLAAVFATVAHAQTACPQPTEWNKANACWTNPTQNTDNTPIPSTCPTGVTSCGKLVSTRIEYGTCQGTAPNQTFGTKVGEITIANPTATQAQLSVTVPQVYCIRALSKNDFTVESAPSNVATRSFSAPTPKAPQLVVDAIAFEVRTGADGKLLAQRIGVVHPGTLCASEDQRVVDGVTYSRVDRSAVDVVNFSNGSDQWIPVVYAKCGVSL
jgi:hypothetical protein